MVSFDIQLDTAEVRAKLEDLKDEWGVNTTYVVGTNVEYAVFP
jgi:hypothetical protein